MKIYLIWARVNDEANAPWVVGAWDEFSMDANYQGYMDALNSAYAEHGAGNVRVTTVEADYHKAVAAFQPVDVTPTATEVRR